MSNYIVLRIMENQYAHIPEELDDRELEGSHDNIRIFINEDLKPDDAIELLRIIADNLEDRYPEFSQLTLAEHHALEDD